VITFPRIFKPAVNVTLAGQPIVSLGLPGPPSPRVAFRVTRTMTSTPDSASIAIYGLDLPRRLAMQTIWSELGRAELLILSGYSGITIKMFLGDVRSLSSTLDGADWITTATADDGGDAIADAAIPAQFTSSAGVDASTMVTIALACINSPAAYVPPAAPPLIPIVPHPSVAAAIATMNPAALTLFYTAVRIGKARDLLDEAARIIGARWWIRDSQLFMAKRKLPVDGLAIVLPRTHWLSEPAEDAGGVVKVATFLDPNLAPGRQVSLVGRVAPGVPEPFRIESGEYELDTESGAPARADLVLRRIL
jgi:hypothetical protein